METKRVIFARFLALDVSLTNANTMATGCQIFVEKFIENQF